jgi:protein-tyrosine phosphatase
LAHPERCVQLTNKPELFEELLSMEIHLQVNWGSFLGHYGSKAKITAVYLATKGYIHCLATDSHRPDQHFTDSLEHAPAIVEEFVGSQSINLLARENPLRVLRGEPLVDMPADEIRPEVKKRWWSIL